MQVRALYMEDARRQHQAVVTRLGTSEINKKLYNWVELSETIFHPKGGGQLPDIGFIDGIKVAYVHKDRQDIYHCFEIDESHFFKIGDEVKLVVNAESRQLNSRLHTAGHVLAEAVNKCFPELEAYQGNHYQGNSYVKFKICAPLQTENKEAIKQKAEEEYSSWIDQDLKVESNLEPSGVRNVKVYQNWSPCGGTHVERLKEIGKMEISDLSINKKEGVVTVKYTI